MWILYLIKLLLKHDTCKIMGTKLKLESSSVLNEQTSSNINLLLSMVEFVASKIPTSHSSLLISWNNFCKVILAYVSFLSLFFGLNKSSEDVFDKSKGFEMVAQLICLLILPALKTLQRNELVSGLFFKHWIKWEEW